MVTRLYLPSSGSAPITPAVSGAWEETVSGFFRAPTSTAHANTSLTSFGAYTTTQATQQSVWAQWISEPLNVDQTISGTLDIVCRGSEGATGDNTYLAVGVRVLSGDGGTVRGTLLFQGTGTGGAEFGTALRTRIWSALSLASVNALAGDRIVVEIGQHAASPGVAPTGTMRFGDPTGTADFALTSNLTTDLVSWLELSQTITFGVPNSLAPTPAASTVAAPTPAISHNLALAPTATASTVSVPSPTLEIDSGISLAPTPAASTVAVPTPAIAHDLQLAPTATASTVAAPSPAVSANLPLAPTPAASTIAAPTPAIAHDLQLAPTATASSVAAPSPALSANLALSATPAASSVSVPLPTLDLSGPINLLALPAPSTVAAPQPALSANLALEALPAASGINVPSPILALAGDQDFACEPAMALVGAPNPTLSFSGLTVAPRRSLAGARLARLIRLDRWPPITGPGP